MINFYYGGVKRDVKIVFCGVITTGLNFTVMRSCVFLHIFSNYQIS